MDFKRKSLLVTVAVVMFGLMAYSFAIKRTLALYTENSLLAESVKTMPQNETSILKMSKQLVRLDSVMMEHGRTSGSGDLLFAKVGEWCVQHGARIRSMSDPTTQQNGEFVVQTLKLQLEGNFIAILKVIDALERNPLTGRVSSVDFRTEAVGPSKVKRLYCDMYVQRFRLAK